MPRGKRRATGRYQPSHQSVTPIDLFLRWDHHRRALAHPRSLEDCYVEDGHVEDGHVEDGSVEDGSVDSGYGPARRAT